MGETRWDEDPQMNEESLMFLLCSLLCRIFVMILICLQNSNRHFEIINAHLVLGRVVSQNSSVGPGRVELGPLDIGSGQVGSRHLDPYSSVARRRFMKE